MIPCNGIHILPARSEPVAQATRARAGERRLSRRRGDATHGERRTTVLGDPAREAPPGDHGGAMATTGSHRAQPFGGRDRRERRRTKRDPRERCQGAAARATPCVAGVPPISGTHRPQGRSMSIRKSPGHLVGAFLVLKRRLPCSSSYFVAPQEEHLYPVVTVSSHASLTCTCSSLASDTFTCSS